MGDNYIAVVIDQERRMTLGMAERQGDLLDDVTRFCDGAVPASSVYGLLHRERDALFPDELFADLFSDRGRRSVPRRWWPRSWCSSAWRGCRTAKRWSATPSTPAGATQRGWAATTVVPVTVLVTPPDPSFQTGRGMASDASWRGYR